MVITDDLAWLWFNNLEGIGRKTISKMIAVFDSPQEIYGASAKTINSLDFITDKQKQKILNKNIDNIIELKERLDEKDIVFVHIEDVRYPKKLINIPDRPYGLYMKYSKSHVLEMFEKPCVAIIGSRNCTEYGYNTAYNIARELASYGIAVISGMARGIDCSAQKGALSGEGATCGVLGCGVDICYPPDNIELYMNIYKEGLLISEAVPGTQPFPGLFPERNRIISGLSDIVIVVEAGEKSGSLITVDTALEQGRDVYAVPGRLGDRLSIGCNRMIKYGAGIYTGAEDILNEFGIEPDVNNCKLTHKNYSLAREEKIVYARLGLDPKHIDTLIEETGMTAVQVMNVLVELELKQLVRQSSFNCYVVI